MMVDLPARNGRSIGTENLDVFRWLNGITVLPTLLCLVKCGIYQQLAKRELNLSDLIQNATEPEHVRIGALCGMLRTLALQGWVELSGVNAESSARATARGRDALEFLTEHISTVERAVHALSQLAHCHAHFRDPEACTAAWISEFGELIEASERRWGTDQSAHRYNRDVVAIIRDYLDGILLGPVIVGLGMPKFAHVDDRLIETSPAIFSRLTLPGQNTLRLNQDIPGLNMPALRSALRLLRAHGLATVSSNHGVARLTPAGRSILGEAANFGVTISYAKTYAYPELILRGTPSGEPDAIDQHVDRVMNIWGSGGSTVISAFRGEIHTQILQSAFDRASLADQPAGIADSGAGSGLPLRAMAEYVIHHTARGRALDTYPLFVLGADYSPAACLRMRETLSDLENIPGVTVMVFQADVSDPDAYDASIRARGLRRQPLGDALDDQLSAADFLHTQMFLLHDRELSLAPSVNAAAFLHHRARSANRWALQDALRPLVGGLANDQLEERDALAAISLKQFTTCSARGGELVPTSLLAADLVSLMDKWRPYLRHGLVLLEPHVPRLAPSNSQDHFDAFDDARVEVDPSPAVWGIHFASGQFLMPLHEHGLAMTIAGLSPALARATGTGSISLSWWVPTKHVYFDTDAAMPPRRQAARMEPQRAGARS